MFCTRVYFSFLFCLLCVCIYGLVSVLDRENIRYKCVAEHIHKKNTFFSFIWIIDTIGMTIHGMYECAHVYDWKRRNTVKTWRAYNNTNLKLFYSKITRNDTAPHALHSHSTPIDFIYCGGVFFFVQYFYFILEMRLHFFLQISHKILFPGKFVGISNGHDNQKWLHCSYEYCLLWSCMQKQESYMHSFTFMCELWLGLTDANQQLIPFIGFNASNTVLLDSK